MTSTEDLNAIILAVQRKWTSLYNVGNIRMLVELYCPDGKAMMPGQAAKQGREGISVALSEMRKKIASYHPHAPDEIGRIDENMVFFSSGFTCYNPDGEPLYPGKGLFLLKKVDGEYLLYADCINYNV
ncbi:uncharacterized protein [Ptychodera flava]|uniref:uncharacterized protein n=1 Tax=Ptychodera flava TaxID=63121 RepID=UPI00396A2C1D